MKAHGFTLVEVLVALAVLAIITSAATALALRGLAATAEARRAETAAALAADLAGRIRALRSVDWTALPAPAPCGLPCPPGQLAAQELAEWQAAVATALPGGAASLEDRGSGQLVVTLAWIETGGSTRSLRWGIAQ